jgi:hypothetical protein
MEMVVVRFGEEYARMLLIFAMVMMYSFSCPLITPFGRFSQFTSTTSNFQTALRGLFLLNNLYLYHLVLLDSPGKLGK